jgi:hypothetical protein
MEVKRLIVSNPFMTANDVRREMALSGTIVPARSTICHIAANRLNLRTRRPAKKPLVIPRHRTERLAFCRAMLQKPEEYWNQVMWSDESKIEQFRSRKTLVRRPPNLRYDPKYTKPTVKFSESVMVWGCFSMNGRGALYILPKNVTMNGERYLQMLKEKLPNFMRILGCGTYQQDGARIHWTPNVRAWLASKGYEVFKWPGNSADLNPIENLWDIMKDRVSEKRPQNLKELIAAIKEVWVREVSPELCRKLAGSMRRRFQAVLHNRGYSSKYLS